MEYDVKLQLTRAPLKSSASTAALIAVVRCELCYTDIVLCSRVVEREFCGTFASFFFSSKYILRILGTAVYGVYDI